MDESDKCVVSDLFSLMVNIVILFSGVLLPGEETDWGPTIGHVPHLYFIQSAESHLCPDDILDRQHKLPMKSLSIAPPPPLPPKKKQKQTHN